MASSLPIPAPPRTPTPPTPIPEDLSEGGLGIDGGPRTRRSIITYDASSLSPLADTFPGRFGSMGSPMPSSAGLGTPSFSESLGPPPPGGSRSPFNFQTQSIKDSPAMANSVWHDNLLTPSSSPRSLARVKFASESVANQKSPKNIGKRRGHRYKHSSVSAQHQIFLEPPARAPLALPASLPIPTWKEAWTSRSTEQTTRIAWCACHALVAAYVLFSADGSLALTALSHLIFFDAVSATICVVVDVLSNFEVWKRSSIRHPFGLERTEVLAGFAMSVFLLFMGFDLMSHNLKHVLEGLGSHAPHHPHSHQRVSPGSVDSAAVLSIVATLISAYGLKNHARIGKAMRFAMISSLPSVLSNPSHFLTLSCSAIMLLLPLLTIKLYLWLDRLLCAVIAISMFVLGVRLAMTQGLMLLMSFSGEGVSDVMCEINKEPMIVSVDEARFWQVHYGLCMANLKLRVRGDELSLQKLRDRLNLLVKNRLGGGYGKGASVKWEVTTQFTIDK
ncbi:related to Anopheles mitochondrial NADH dehydrogenase subunit 2 [Rhynchosporium agropyri]|uniref:Zinc transporter n=1 Tax=Rhynchosporium agropyri TaxID=914238 RepID=A0A1E1KY77_9HELO|nr:related to Anopheles mitochondrial NADH dehydrogenase subunit 2 [Rhynchosporium agropyri]